jgi:hypothetical protein
MTRMLRCRARCSTESPIPSSSAQSRTVAQTAGVADLDIHCDEPFGGRHERRLHQSEQIAPGPFASTARNDFVQNRWHDSAQIEVNRTKANSVAFAIGSAPAKRLAARIPGRPGERL